MYTRIVPISYIPSCLQDSNSPSFIPQPWLYNLYFVYRLLRPRKRTYVHNSYLLFVVVGYRFENDVGDDALGTSFVRMRDDRFSIVLPWYISYYSIYFQVVFGTLISILSSFIHHIMSHITNFFFKRIIYNIILPYYTI